MIIYGIKIDSDIKLSYRFPKYGNYKYKISLSSYKKSCKKYKTYRVYLHKAHQKDIFLYSNKILKNYNKNANYAYVVKDTVEFFFSMRDNSIYYKPLKEYSVEKFSFWFSHLMLPFYISLKKWYYFLHCSSVKLHGKSILFLAPSMGGKSTMNSLFLSKKARLISDDKLATFIKNDKIYLTSSHPYYRPYRKFEELGYRADKFIAKFDRIDIIYHLEKSDNNSITITEIKGFQKVHILLNSYIFNISIKEIDKFNYINSISKGINMFSIKIPWDLKRLNDVFNYLEKEVK
jgi:hypothetical protein